MSLIFVAAILPPLCVAIAWAVITVLRIYFPDRPLPFGHDPVWIHQHVQAKAEPTQVGVRDIRDDQRRMTRSRPAAPYAYSSKDRASHKIPDAWADEIWFRRN